MKTDLIPKIQELRAAIEADPPHIENLTAQYALTPEDEAVSFEQMLDGFAQQLRGIQRILERAAIRFSS